MKISCWLGFHRWKEVDRKLLKTERVDPKYRHVAKWSVIETSRLTLRCQDCPEKIQIRVERTVSGEGHGKDKEVEDV